MRMLAAAVLASLMLIPATSANLLNAVDDGESEANAPDSPVPALIDKPIDITVCLGEVDQVENEPICVANPSPCGWYLQANAKIDLRRDRGIYLEVGDGIGAYAGYYDPCPP